MPTTSKLAASTCTASCSAGSRRVRAVRRDSTRLISTTPFWRVTCTQSPVTGAVSAWARTESEPARTMPSAVTTSHSPLSTWTTPAYLRSDFDRIGHAVAVPPQAQVADAVRHRRAGSVSIRTLLPIAAPKGHRGWVTASR